jgi:hypothetical protein
MFPQKCSGLVVHVFGVGESMSIILCKCVCVLCLKLRMPSNQTVFICKSNYGLWDDSLSVDDHRGSLMVKGGHG